MFVGRKEELAKLEQAYRHDGFSVFVVFGRDGAGKTALLEEFCKDKDAIFFHGLTRKLKGQPVKILA